MFIMTLIKSKENYDFLFKQKMKRMDYSMGLFVYYFGSKKKYRKCSPSYYLFWRIHIRNILNKIFEKKELVRRYKLLFHRPSATDPNMSPGWSRCILRSGPCSK